MALAAVFVPLLGLVHAAWWHEVVPPDELGSPVLLAPTVPFLLVALIVATAAGLVVTVRGPHWAPAGWTGWVHARSSSEGRSVGRAQLKYGDIARSMRRIRSSMYGWVATG